MGSYPTDPPGYPQQHPQPCDAVVEPEPQPEPLPQEEEEEG